MRYQVNNIIYASGEDLRNTLRFGIFFREKVQIGAMKEAAEEAAVRFPFFKVKMVREGETYFLEENEKPFVFHRGSEPLKLNSPESGGHLIAFSWEDDRIFLDTTHFLTDGNGAFPFIRTLLYCYLKKIHPEAEFDTSCIARPGDEIPAEEREDNPYPAEPIPIEPVPARPLPEKILKLPEQEQGYGKMASWTAFLFRIAQKETMKYVSSVDGSPATFLASLVYRAIDSLHPENEFPVVCGMQHQFRHAFGKNQSHLCHVNLVPMLYPVRLRGADIERLNTIGRGSLILRASDEADLETVNAHIQNEKAIRTMTLSEKHDFMKRAVKDGIGNNTFEVSYTGRVAWGGLDKYVSFLTPYLDLTLSGGISVEIFSRDSDFDINIMQRNGDEKTIRRVFELLGECGISYDHFRTEHFSVPEFSNP